MTGRVSVGELPGVCGCPPSDVGAPSWPSILTKCGTKKAASRCAIPAATLKVRYQAGASAHFLSDLWLMALCRWSRGLHGGHQPARQAAGAHCGAGSIHGGEDDPSEAAGGLDREGPRQAQEDDPDHGVAAAAGRGCAGAAAAEGVPEVRRGGSACVTQHKKRVKKG